MQEQNQNPRRKVWETPKLETLDLSSTDSGDIPFPVEQSGHTDRPLSNSEPKQSEVPIRKAWLTPKLETLELVSTEGGSRPDNKENGAKFVAS